MLMYKMYVHITGLMSIIRQFDQSLLVSKRLIQIGVAAGFDLFQSKLNM